MPAKGHQQSQDATWRGLYMRLRVSKGSIQAWRKLPGAPQEPVYDEWKKFIEEQQLGVSGNKVGKAREEALAESVELRNKLLEIQLKRAQRQTVNREEINRLLYSIATQQKTMIYQKLVNELPPKAEGLTVAEIRNLGREIADQVCDLMTKDLPEAVEATQEESPASLVAD